MARLGMGLGFGTQSSQFAPIFGSESRNFTTFNSPDSESITVADVGATTTCIMEVTFATTTSGLQYMCGRHSGDRFYLGTNESGPIWGNGSSFFTGPTIVHDGKIHTMRSEVVGSNMLSYLDGALLNTSPLSWTEVLDAIAIGKQGNSASNFFTGIIYNYKITSGGVLKRFYKLDETWIGPSTVAVDSGADGSDGTAVNITSADSENFTFNGSVTPNTWTNDSETITYEVAEISARFIMLGASIINNAWATELNNFQSEVETEFSKGILMYNEASGGWTTTVLKDNIDAILATYPDPSSELFNTYCPVHIGGNNVTNTRPYSTATELEKDTITDDITYILAAITTKGFIPVLADITFRDYDDTTVASPENGSLPYNENLIRPLVSSQFKYVSGKPWLQYYDMILADHATYLLADNVHHTAAGEQAMRDHFKDTIVNYVLTGTSPTEI